MNGLAFDVRQAARTLGRSRWLFAGAVLTLALGIGANGAVFSILQAVLLQPLPYRDQDRVVMVQNRIGAATRAGVTGAKVNAWRAQSQDAFSGLAALRMWSGNLDAQLDLVRGDRAERLRAGLVTANFFEVLGAGAVHGRVFGAADETAGARDLIVLGHALWLRSFGGDVSIIGKSVSLVAGRSPRAPRPFVVVGVLAPTFRFTYPLETELWALLPWSDVRPDGRSIEFNGAVARLRPGVDIERARTVMADVGINPARLNDPPERRESTGLIDIYGWVVGEARPSLLLLGAVAVLLLFITCFTVANALFMRVTERQRELALRASLGAGRDRLIRQALAEGAILAAAGAVAGTALAILLAPVLRMLVPPVLPRGDEIGVNASILFFEMAAAGVTVILAALAPALRSGRLDVVSVLKRSSATMSPDRSTALWRKSLLGTQAAVATALLVAAALLLVSFWRLNRVDLGFDGSHVLTVEMRLLDMKYRQAPARAAFQDQLLDRLRAVPGLVDVAITSAVPFRGVDFYMSLSRQGESKRTGGNARYVTADFFDVMKVPLVKGRLFLPSDTLTSPKVVVISEAFGRAAFGDADPVGQRIDEENWEIVGVVRDVRYVQRDREPVQAIYLSAAQAPVELMCVVARTAASAGDLGPAVRHAIREVDPAIPAMNLTTIDRIIDESVADRRFLTTSTVTFAGLAVLLTLVGMMLVVSRAVAERRRELAIRSALGAWPASLIRLVMRQGLWPVLIGTVAGLAVAYSLASLLASFLFEVESRGLVLYAGVGAFVLLVAVAASLAPAYRVRSTSPAVLLRTE